MNESNKILYVGLGRPASDSPTYLSGGPSSAENLRRIFRPPSGHAELPGL
jgi:hypothetical protein